MADDAFTQLPIRLLGFGFAVGEAIRYNFSLGYVDLCNNITIVFVAVHVLYTGFSTMALGPLVGTILFEGICSCIIPPVVNYQVCKFVCNVCWDIKTIPKSVTRWAPVLAGLLTIPLFIVYVDPVMNDFLTTNIVPIFGE